MAAAFHQPVRFRNLIQCEDAVDDRCDLAAFDQRPDLIHEIVTDGAFLVRRARAHGGAGDGQALDHDRREVDLVGHCAPERR